MKPGLLKKLNKLKDKQNDLIEALAKALEDESISIDEFFVLKIPSIPPDDDSSSEEEPTNVITSKLIHLVGNECLEIEEGKLANKIWKRNFETNQYYLSLYRYAVSLLFGNDIEQDVDGAIAFLKQVVNNLGNTSGKKCLYYLGYAYCLKKDFEEAFSCFEKLPSDYDLLKNLFTENNQYKRLYNLYTLYKSADKYFDPTANPIPEMETTSLENNPKIRVEDANSGTVQEEELHTALIAEKRFFDPGRTYDTTPRWLSLLLLRRRLSTQAITAKVNLEDDTPFRQIITAERSTVEASKKSNGGVQPGPYANRLGWHAAHQVDEEREEWFSYYEYLKIGNTTLKYTQKVNPYPTHLGDYYMKNLGEYSNILDQINTIINHPADDVIKKEKEQKLAQFIREFVSTGKPITLASLKTINDNADDDDVNNINRICYHCFVKEPARWMFHNNQLPIAIAQARMLELLVAGHISMQQAFDEDSPFGVVTVKKVGNNWAAVKGKIKALNRLYAEKILVPQVGVNPQQSYAFARRKQFHVELRNTYGGASDTDGAGYTSSEPESDSSGDELPAEKQKPVAKKKAK